MSSSLQKKRVSQLDGLRALAILSVCWFHWQPEQWKTDLPYEIGLYFFLVLTGYFITSHLLKIREALEQKGGAWLWQAWKQFQSRRMLRILVPYYVALGVGLLFMVPSLWESFAWYIFPLTNIHIAIEGKWPAATSHFWTLSLQWQFYLIWPLLIWFIPKRFLALSMFLVIGLSVSLGFFPHLFKPFVVWPHKLTWCWFDFFAAGSLLSLAIARGLSFSSPIWRIMMILGCGAYLFLELGRIYEWHTIALGPLSRPILAIGLCGLIAVVSHGTWRPVAWVLECSLLQKIGLYSYGIYLYHNIAPIILGKIMPFLWNSASSDQQALLVLKLSCFVALTGLLSFSSWRYLEVPLDRFRNRG